MCEGKQEISPLGDTKEVLQLSMHAEYTQPDSLRAPVLFSE